MPDATKTATVVTETLKQQRDELKLKLHLGKMGAALKLLSEELTHAYDRVRERL